MTTTPTYRATELEDLEHGCRTCVGPEEIYDSPTVDIGKAVVAADQLGRAAAREPFDRFSHEARLAYESVVGTIALLIPAAVGDRARQILNALAAGELTPPMPDLTDRRPWWRRISPLSWFLMVPAIPIEAVVGAKVWEAVSPVGDQWSWAFGVLFAVTLNVISLKVAPLIHAARPRLVHHHGLWLGGGIAAIVVSLLLVYGYVLAGGGGQAAAAGAVTGGTAASTPTVIPDPTNWTLMALYVTFMTATWLAVTLSHIHDLEVQAQKVLMARLAAQDAQLSQEQQESLAAQLLTQCVKQGYESPEKVRAVIRSYVGGARHTLSPELNSMWSTDHLENLQVDPPAWIADIEREIQALTSPSH